MTYRSGIGFDAHRFAPAGSRPLHLALLTWPGEPGLEGHSDGDVATHALVDALLSAAGLGDIGRLFGVADPRFQNAASAVFLRNTMLHLRQEGFLVVNAAVQVIGNRPAIAPRRAEAEAALSEILEAPVNVSGTTTDAMGFTGRGEGLAAVATCLLGPAPVAWAA
ncbi:MAG: 2-C-methyl-D-erythritol 2,4-cyclodiphosphate synthase [Bifidobacteriaceae bacterium]|jgi:2-C-methyl-D-erythritol 4-phosphate cytidylyltransferase/2-C-methyl-D-erythritol 2,4-cyclodiphosphate synthase|nr:2-C-methyl-D-erythritol 2,4-cyclodiphosphate synthase [Bifidobacteriaceae bacterium]